MVASSLNVPIHFKEKTTSPKGIVTVLKIGEHKAQKNASLSKDVFKILK